VTGKKNTTRALILILSVGQAGEAWEPSDKTVLFVCSKEHWTKNSFTLPLCSLQRDKDIFGYFFAIVGQLNDVTEEK
jgi:hypothetical protein